MKKYVFSLTELPMKFMLIYDKSVFQTNHQRVDGPFESRPITPLQHTTTTYP